MPSPQGFWPAFWTFQPPGANYYVETDVYEFYSNNHFLMNLTQHGGTGGGCQNFNLGYDATLAYHTYGADIESTGTTWYFDGNKVCQTTSTSNNLGAVITNLAVYSTIPPASTTTTATKKVDYIRVWQ